MQKITGTTIEITRGDTLNISLSIKEDGDNYTFQPGDVVVFSVYKKGKLSENAVLLKTINVSSSTESLSINFTSEETKIGDLINKPVDYWYEVELNGQYTVIGYDDTGAKILRLYPEGSQDDD